LISFHKPHQHEFDSLERAHWTVDDWKAVFALAAFFIVMLIGSWQRWTQPIIDHGREMNLPARIASGEQLYADVQFLYGPFAPYFNAAVYRVFGVRLAALHLVGGICAWIIILTIYWLSRQLLRVWEAAITTALVIVFCAVKYSGNYISPYAYAALYGLVFSLISLAQTSRYWRDQSPGRLFWAGVFAGLGVVTKWEIALSALAAAAVAVLLSSIVARKVLWKDALRFLTPVVVIPGATVALLLSRVSKRVLLDDNHILFSNMPPQLVYFNRLISGIAALPQSFWFTLSGLGSFALWCGVIAMLGALIGRKKDEAWGRLAGTGFAITFSGLAFWIGMREALRIHDYANLLNSMPLVLPVIIVALVIHLCKRRADFSKELGLVLLLAVFAQVAILRVILRVSTSGPYAPFYLPVVLIIAAFVILTFVPLVLAPPGALREGVRRVAVVALGLLTIGMAASTIRRFRAYKSYEVSGQRGRFYTEESVGAPLAGAIKYARENTSEKDVLPTMPQATAINFLAEREYPFRQEIIHPGFMTDQEGIERIEKSGAPIVLVANLLTPEFRDVTFGTDYNSGLWQWINKHYYLVERFDSNESQGAVMGDKPFFILAFKRKDLSKQVHASPTPVVPVERGRGAH
jgi:hypothetical protein